MEERAVVTDASESEALNRRLAQLEHELHAERVRRRGLFFVLVGVAALELARFLAPLTHPAVALFGSVFCLVYVLYGLYLYSTQERFLGAGAPGGAGQSGGEREDPPPGG
jgi:uncharacterized protein YjeT (DUF2065 family)